MESCCHSKFITSGKLQFGKLESIQVDLNAMLVSISEEELKFQSRQIGFVASGMVLGPLTLEELLPLVVFFFRFLSVWANLLRRDMPGQPEIYYAYNSATSEAIYWPQLSCSDLPTSCLRFHYHPLVATPAWNSAEFAKRPLLCRLHQKKETFDGWLPVESQ